MICLNKNHKNIILIYVQKLIIKKKQYLTPLRNKKYLIIN